jgi:hypothetical protein
MPGGVVRISARDDVFVVSFDDHDGHIEREFRNWEHASSWALGQSRRLEVKVEDTTAYQRQRDSGR